MSRILLVTAACTVLIDLHVVSICFLWDHMTDHVRWCAALPNNNLCKYPAACDALLFVSVLRLDRI